MTIDKCIIELSKGVGDLLTGEQTSLIVNRMAEDVDNASAFGLEASADTAVENFSKELVKLKRDAIINANAMAKLRQRLSHYPDAPHLGILSAITPLGFNITGAKHNAHTISRMWVNKLQQMHNDILDQHPDLVKPYRRGEIDRDIKVSMEAIEKGHSSLDGITDDVFEFARKIRQLGHYMVSQKNKRGANIEILEGFFQRNSHNLNKIYRAGFEEWSEFVMPRLDWDRIAQRIDPKAKKAFEAKGQEAPVTVLQRKQDFLRSVYNELISRRYGAVRSDVNASSASRAAAGLSSEESMRVLLWKDAISDHEYTARFGERSMSESVYDSINNTAQAIGLMEIFGTNWNKMFKELREDATEMYKDLGDPKAVAKINSSRLQQVFDNVNGTSNMVDNKFFAKTSSNIRHAMSWALLGKVILAALPDIAQSAARIKLNGGNFLQGFANGLTAPLQRMSKSATRQYTDLIGVYVDEFVSAVAGSRLTMEEIVEGKVQGFNRLFYKVNMLHAWTDAQYRATASLLSRLADRNRSKDWDALDDAFRGELDRHEISADDWDIIRKSEPVKINGKSFVDPSKMPEAQADKFMLWMTSQSDRAVNLPEPRTESFWNRGRGRGEAAGEALRFVGQFKAFPTQVLFGNVADTINQRVTDASLPLRHRIKDKSVIMNLAVMAVSSTVLGYISLAAGAISQNKTPPDPSDPDVVAKAMVKGGSGGMLADLFLMDANSTGQALKRMVGPAPSQAIDLAIKTRNVLSPQGDKTYAEESARFLKELISNMPAQNLIVVGDIFQHAVNSTIIDLLDPTYIDRMNRRIERETGQGPLIE